METKNELMEAYCKPSCIDEVFEVKDSLGNVLEVVNNSEGEQLDKFVEAC